MMSSGGDPGRCGANVAEEKGGEMNEGMRSVLMCVGYSLPLVAAVLAVGLWLRVRGERASEWWGPADEMVPVYVSALARERPADVLFALHVVEELLTLYGEDALVAAWNWHETGGRYPRIHEVVTSLNGRMGVLAVLQVAEGEKGVTLGHWSAGGRTLAQEQAHWQWLARETLRAEAERSGGGA